MLEYDWGGVFPLGVGLKSEPLLHCLLGKGKCDEREILQDAVRFRARVSLVEKFKEFSVFFPLSNLQRLVHGLPINSFEPKLVSIVA